MRRWLWPASALAAVMLAGVLAGCGAAGEKAAQVAVEKATGVKVDEKKGTVTVTGKDDKGGTATLQVSGGDGGSASLPEGYPAALLPLFPGAKIESALKMNQGGKDFFTVSLETNKSFEEVKAFYLDALKKAVGNNLNQFEASSGDEKTLTMGGEGQNKSLGVIVVHDTKDKKTTIQISVTDK